MSGVNWQIVAEDPIFRPNRLQEIINELPPNTDILRATNAFMPRRDAMDIFLLTTVISGPFGLTNPLGDLGSQHAYIPGPRLMQFEHTVGHWREAIQLTEKTLLLLATALLAGNRSLLEEHIARSLQLLDIRVDNRIEYVTLQVLLNGSYTVNEFGVNYTYQPKHLRPYLTVDISGGSAPWGTVAPWSDTANADIMRDTREMIAYLRSFGVETRALWFPKKVGGYIEDNAKVRDFIKASPMLSEKLITSETLFGFISEFRGLSVYMDDRRYIEEYRIQQPVSAGATQIFLDRVDRLSTGDTIVLEGGDGSSEKGTISSINASLRRITLSAGVANAYSVGDAVKLFKRFYDSDTKVLFLGEVSPGMPTANWMSVPSLAAANEAQNPRPGKTPWRTFQFQKNPKYLELGNGISGGPVIHRQNWGVLKVA